MPHITYRIILVVGDNHKEIAMKYSADKNDNPKAYYKYQRCQQTRLEKTGEEGDFSDPFPLKNGEKSYSAHYNDIDWEQIHRNPQKIKLNERVWDLVLNDDEPQNEYEKTIKNRMFEKIDYFVDNFKSKEDFINYSTSLWYWGIATKEKYEEVNSESDNNDTIMDWCVNFFDNFIKPLENTNPLITIYETHSL